MLTVSMPHARIFPVLEASNSNREIWFAAHLTWAANFHAWIYFESDRAMPSCVEDLFFDGDVYGTVKSCLTACEGGQCIKAR
ncbi:MAG: hypothetical protein V4454_02640 [Pseudomonadota bacterium]